MNDALRQAALASLDILGAVAGAIPAIQAFGPALVDIGRVVLQSGHEDPAARLREIGEQLRGDVETAFFAKYPEGR